MNIKVAIIGGSGFYSLSELTDPVFRSVETEFGDPSDEIAEGYIDGVPCVVLARHGRGHSISPSEVNYRANIWALKSLGVTHILSATCCGSLREDMAPGDFVLLDSFIDRTTKRHQSFHDRNSSPEFGKVCHIPMHPTFCPRTRDVISEAAKSLGMENVHEKGTMVTVEGPRFSSKAESKMFRAWGADVINMTTVPEVVLAKEAGISYASIAMVTDYDCWKEDTEPVSVQTVLAVLAKNVDNVKKLFLKSVQLLAEQKWDQTIKENHETAKNSVMSHN